MSKHRRGRKGRDSDDTPAPDPMVTQKLSEMTARLLMVACDGPDAIAQLCQTIVTIDPDIARTQAMLLASLSSEPLRRQLDRNPDAMPGFYLKQHGKPDDPVDVEKADPYARCAGRMVVALGRRDYDAGRMLLDTFTAQHPDQLPQLLGMLLAHAHHLMHIGGEWHRL